MSRRVIFSIVLTAGVALLWAYGTRDRVFNPPQHVLVDKGDEDARNLKSVQEVDPQPGAQAERITRVEEPSSSPEGIASEDPEIEESHRRALELQDEAMAYFDKAAELREQGSEQESLEHELKGVELSQRASDLLFEAQEQLARAHEGQEGFEEQGASQSEEDPSTVIDLIRSQAQGYLDQAEALRESAVQSRERGDELEAADYEQMALELEAAANEAFDQEEQILHDSKEVGGIEDENQPS